MVLVQATYFKGFWLDKFDPRRTVKSYFKGTKGKVEVDMMSQQAKFPYAQCEWLSCSAIELPYARGDGSDRYDLSMLILLPDEDDGLAALEASLTASDLAKLRSSMTTSGKVNLKLPRFSMESSLKLKEVLISLGMVSAFSEKHADFTGLVEQLSEDLYLSEVYHKAFVEVNEEGSEAAAATGAAIKKRSMCISRNLFVVDHPFLIFIIDRRADIVLFMGRLVNPAHSERAGNQEL
ncbi:hypothetical protein C0Q70_21010 [Pomacea canaliculata]|uniref:Serpin domain-containing protein n=2 Tax=Pomacea canaliculata TaxID=400727 RepID=A0A2T7NBC0_POMCA|nr:hypothetical protein C0Q70_21010 [Pomacea canaliculata]